MKIMGKNNTQKGLTLVEVLAALVILGIVFVGFMTVFPQMTLFNAKTETKLDTMNLAREEMNKIVNIDEWNEVNIINNSESKVILNPFYSTLVDTSDPNTWFEEQQNDDGSITVKEYNRYLLKNNLYNDYTFELLIYIEPDLEGTISLHKTILRVRTSNEKVSSETYGYIEVKEGS